MITVLSANADLFPGRERNKTSLQCQGKKFPEDL
jgi:hypothetical protein